MRPPFLYSRDQIRLTIDRAFQKTQPSVDPRAYRLDFVNVYERALYGGLRCSNLFVVRCIVRRSASAAGGAKHIFKNRRGKAFYRRDGSLYEMGADIIEQRLLAKAKADAAVAPRNDAVNAAAAQAAAAAAVASAAAATAAAAKPAALDIAEIVRQVLLTQQQTQTPAAAQPPPQPPVTVPAPVPAAQATQAWAPETPTPSSSPPPQFIPDMNIVNELTTAAGLSHGVVLGALLQLHSAGNYDVKVDDVLDYIEAAGDA
jgi:hypothetical protein